MCPGGNNALNDRMRTAVRLRRTIYFTGLTDNMKKPRNHKGSVGAWRKQRCRFSTLRNGVQQTSVNMIGIGRCD